MSAEHGQVSTKVYFKVYYTLLFLTVVTVALSYVDLTRTGNLTVGLAVAITKALCVAFIFMHLKYEKFLIRFTAIFGIIIFVIMNTGVYLDIIHFLRSDANKPPAVAGASAAHEDGHKKGH